MRTMPTTEPAATDATNEHAVVIAGGGPTGLMLAGELALAGVDVAVVEPRPDQELAGSRAGGLQSRSIEVLDQRGIAERFLSAGQPMQGTGFALIPLDIGDLPTRHPYGLALRQNAIERLLAGWTDELGVPFVRGCTVAGLAQDARGVDVELSDGRSVRTGYLVGCDGGRSRVRTAASGSPGGTRRRARSSPRSRCARSPSSACAATSGASTA